MDQKAGRDDATQCREASSVLVHSFRLAIGLGMIRRVETAIGTKGMIKMSSTHGKGISDSGQTQCLWKNAMEAEHVLDWQREVQDGEQGAQP